MKSANPLVWQTKGKYLEGTTKGYKYTDKFAWFDMDGTIITTKSGKPFAINKDDWKFLYDNTVEKIQKLAADGFCIMIITNQAGIEKKSTDPNEWMKKINAIHKDLNVEMKVLCSTGKNEFRKPFSTFYYDFVSFEIRDICDRNKSFYCGDACGRPGDHSDCDYKFAMNCLLTFYTPEQLFLGQKVKIPKIVYPDIHSNKTINPPMKCVHKTKHMIIMIGYPASGKSFLSNLYKQKYGYQLVNQDTLKNKQKCLKVTNTLASEGHNIIIDNTNPSKETRKEYIDIAKKYEYTVSAIHFTTSYELSMHRNHFRLLTSGYLIPEIGYRVYKKNFCEPKLDEGFCEIVKQDHQAIKDPRYLEFLY